MKTGEQALCDAIWSQTLNDVVAQSDGLDEARACLAQIEAETADARDDIVAALSDAGIDVQGTALKPQFHAFDLRIAPQDVPRALRIAAGQGFVLAGQFSTGAANALSRFEDHLPLMKRGAETLRMTLIWREKSPKRRWPARLRPKLVDYGFAALPGWAWWMYPAIKPFRMIAERVNGTRFEDRLDGYLAEVNLGTPTSLLAPLCDFAGIGPSDVLLDIGCGDARFLIDAVRQTGCKAIGIERNRPLAERGQQAIAAAGLSDQITCHARLAEPDDLAQASVVFMFQPPGALRHLLPWVLEHRPVHTRILVHEQAGMQFPTPPDVTRPLFGSNALTVAHLWHASERDK